MKYLNNTFTNNYRWEQACKAIDQNTKPDGSVIATVILCQVLVHVLSILL